MKPYVFSFVISLYLCRNASESKYIIHFSERQELLQRKFMLKPHEVPADELTLGCKGGILYYE